MTDKEDTQLYDLLRKQEQELCKRYCKEHEEYCPAYDSRCKRCHIEKLLFGIWNQLD